MDIKARTFKIGPGVDPEELKARVRSEFPGTLVQTLRAGLASNASFVEMIAAQTIRAASTGNLIADRPEIDLLLRFAVTTQISQAIKTAGSRSGERFLLVAAASGKSLRTLGKQFPEAKELPRRRLTEKELVAVEKAALLNALRA